VTCPPGLLPTLTAAGRAAAPRTLVDVFGGLAAAYPDALAIDTGSETLTYAELGEAAHDLAESLARLG
jgi:non-ribosomal peptide synthetase component E (peptide arylation enzyme)